MVTLTERSGEVPSEVPEQSRFAPRRPAHMFYSSCHVMRAITSQHASKRTAKGTSSFNLDIKIHQRQPQPRNKLTNRIVKRHENFYKWIVFAIMYQQGKSNPVNHRNRKEVPPLPYPMTAAQWRRALLRRKAVREQWALAFTFLLLRFHLPRLFFFFGWCWGLNPEPWAR